MKSCHRMLSKPLSNLRQRFLKIRMIQKQSLLKWKWNSNAQAQNGCLYFVSLIQWSISILVSLTDFSIFITWNLCLDFEI